LLGKRRVLAHEILFSLPPTPRERLGHPRLAVEVVRDQLLIHARARSDRTDARTCVTMRGELNLRRLEDQRPGALRIALTLIRLRRTAEAGGARAANITVEN